MKIILSRKGFDSSRGGVASPIFPDGTLLSLPIPSRNSPIKYEDIRFRDRSIGITIEHLTRGQISRQDSAHLDPDLIACAYPRLPGWRPLFGQAGAAQSHLENAQVSAGDLFLFFGWFRRIETVSGRYRHVPDAPDLHVIYGWLQIGTILHLEQERFSVPRWAAYHPHLHGMRTRNNTIYVANELLRLDEEQTMLAGGGAFAQYRDDLCLTAPNHTRSVWRLPEWFYPESASAALSYHSDLERWILGDGYTILRSVSRGQEFVLDVDQYPLAADWAHSFISGSAGSGE